MNTEGFPPAYQNHSPISDFTLFIYYYYIIVHLKKEAAKTISTHLPKKPFRTCDIFTFVMFRHIRARSV